MITNKTTFLLLLVVIVEIPLGREELLTEHAMHWNRRKIESLAAALAKRLTKVITLYLKLLRCHVVICYRYRVFLPNREESFGGVVWQCFAFKQVKRQLQQCQLDIKNLLTENGCGEELKKELMRSWAVEVQVLAKG